MDFKENDNTGTMPVLEKHAIDTAALQGFMQANVSGFEGEISIEEFKGGQSNPTYKVVSPSKSYVLRRKPPGKLLKSAHAVDREYRVITALNKTDVPVAKMYLYCDDSSIIGTSFYIMEYIEGRVIEDTKLEGFEIDERTAIYDSMNSSLAALHNVNIKEDRLEDFITTGSYFTRQIKRWSSQWELSKQHDMPEMPLIKGWLESNIPEDDKTTIVHGDYRIANTI